MGTVTFSVAPLSWKLIGGRATTYRCPKPVLASAMSRLPSLKQPQVTHSMPQEKVELFKSLEPWVSKNVLPLLKPVEKCWQPSEFLPDPSKSNNDFIDEVVMLQNCTIGVADEYFVVLVGNMIIEDAIPTYQTLFNTFDGVQDDTGASPCSWAVWSRGWTAEENRHGDLLRSYLYLSGRVDMVMVEKTVQYLIRAGMDGGLENNPYLGFVYATFQERATFVNHGNLARIAKERGDSLLATICGTIAADEKRHENAYTRIIEKLLEVDPNETMLAIGKMMRKGVAMPGSLMYDGRDTNLFEHMSFVNQRLGLYTTYDYMNILEFLIVRWKLEKLDGLGEDGRKEQEFVCRLPNMIRKLHERAEEREKKAEPHPMKFSWIFNKEVLV